MRKAHQLVHVRRITAVILAWMIVAVGYRADIVLAGPPDRPLPTEGENRATEEERDRSDASAADAAKNKYAVGHESVLRAFRAVVARPAKSTVRILRDGRQVALGCIVDSDGLIATKGSEVGGQVTCELADGTQYAAELVGVDHGSDLALLRIPEHGLPEIRWSTDEPPTVGGWVVTPGTGELPRAIGIVSVAAHPVRGGVLGVQLAEDEPGPRITKVVPQSGAAIAGLTTGDIVTHINGQPVNSSESMIAMTSAMLPDEEVKLTIVRHGKPSEVTAFLGSVSDTLTSQRARFQDQLGTRLSERRYLFPSALEHDSVLEPNECGGSLVDLRGETIGINIARANRISSYAIPASVARPILESLKRRLTVPVSGQADNQRSSDAAAGG